MRRTILLSFDVEEFDLPLEYGQKLGVGQQLQIGAEGLENLRPVLKKHGVPATLFTTAFFAMNKPDLIREMGADHEIASHSFCHSSYSTGDLLRARQTLEEVCGKPVHGLRMPRMKEVPAGDVLQAGYSYNSSLNPTWLPGRYDHRHKPRTPFVEEGLLQLPASVTPHLRVPLFWLAFKNLPYGVFRRLAIQTLRHDGHLMLYFHPWEFTNLSGFRLPGYTRRQSGQRLLAKLERLIEDLAEEGEFDTVGSFCRNGLVLPGSLQPARMRG